MKISIYNEFVILGLDYHKNFNGALTIGNVNENGNEAAGRLRGVH